MALRWLTVAGERPQEAALRLAAPGIEHRRPGFVHEELAGALETDGQAVDHGRQVERRLGLSRPTLADVRAHVEARIARGELAVSTGNSYLGAIDKIGEWLNTPLDRLPANLDWFAERFLTCQDRRSCNHGTTMQSHIDLTDHYSTAAAAIAASRQAAVHLRLPALLGERSAGCYGILAERMEDARVLEDLCRDGLATVIARCERVIAEGTTDVTQLDETGRGPTGAIYTPERVRIRTREAEALCRIVRSLRSAPRWAGRTHDIIVGQATVERLRR